MTDRRNFRKVYSRIWTSQDFQSIIAEDKLLTLYLLTGPQTNRIGFFRIPVASAAEELGTSIDAFYASLQRVCIAFGWRWDGRAKVFYIPSWWIYNPLKDNTQNLKGYLTDLNDVPRTELIVEFCANIKGIPESQRHLLNGWEEALTPRAPSGLSPSTVGGSAPAPPEHRPGTVGGSVGDPARTTKTETETETETETGTALTRAEAAAVTVPIEEPPKEPEKETPKPRSDRPSFVGQRLSVFQWQFDEWARILGPSSPIDPFSWVQAKDFALSKVNEQLPAKDKRHDWLTQLIQADAMRAGQATARAPTLSTRPRPKNCRHNPQCADEIAHTSRYIAEMEGVPA